MMAPIRVVIVGASMAGLMAALALARRGAEVQLLDRDDTMPRVELAPNGEIPLEASWRKGVPQARHTHALAALGRQVLRSRAPDVWRALLDAGAIEMPFGGTLGAGYVVPRVDDDALFGLSSRRSLIEAVVRRIVCAEPNVTLRDGVVATGLLAHAAPGRLPVVEGVRTSHGDVRADLTIDALGRASPFAKWLQALGTPAPEESAEQCGLTYLTRWYRLRQRPAVQLTAGFSAGGYAASSGCIACPADHGYVSVTMMIPHGDAMLLPLSDPSTFTAAAHLHPGLSDWLDIGAGEPVSDVIRWPGCENRFRRFVVDGRPLALGLVGIGDSICVTNPVYTRGMSLAARHAFAIADLVDTVGLGDRYRLAMEADSLAQALLRPWFDDSVAQDRARIALWRGDPHPPAGSGSISLQQIAAAARHDIVVWHALARRAGMLDEPDAIFARDDLLERVRRALSAYSASPSSGPTRQDLLRLVEARNAETSPFKSRSSATDSAPNDACTEPAFDVTAARRRFLLDENITCLNHGMLGACPIDVLDRQTEWRTRIERLPSAFILRELPARFDDARQALAGFIGADPANLVLLPNVTTALSAVLRSWSFDPGDEILTTDHAYLSCRNLLDFVARRTGARIVVARIQTPVSHSDAIVDAVLDRVTARTRLAVLDHVTSPTAIVFPIATLVDRLNDFGVDTLVDGAHAPGMLPLDVEAIGAAYYAGNCHKWLCSPRGAGFLHVRRDRADGLHPPVISRGYGVSSTDRPRLHLEFDWLGTADPTPLICIPDAIRFLRERLPGGFPALFARNRELAIDAAGVLERALPLVRLAPDAMVGSMVAFQLPEVFASGSGDAAASLQQRLYEVHGIDVSVASWPDARRLALRISAQIYNSIDDFRRLGTVLRGMFADARNIGVANDAHSRNIQC
ncbi:aminotransferase class V-fold PLP-dependent enzyme [Trinickia sp.]|uniref:aminotransferase class V-fold PLP-dependent enzyme n=1 Tax=Trinickia sp. TaxID=2571163 RepID=UPI003F7E1857